MPERSFSPNDSLRHFMYEAIFEVLDRELVKGKSVEVLDFGSKWYGDESGIGWATFMRTMLKAILGNENVEHTLATYPEWDLDGVIEGQFDVVVADQTLEHVPRPWVAADNLHRVLKPGGVAVITTPGFFPIHRSPIDCWRIMPDGYDVLFPNHAWTVLEKDFWGSAERLAHECARKPVALPDGPPFPTVESETGTPGYVAGNDGRFPLMQWFIARKR